MTGRSEKETELGGDLVSKLALNDDDDDTGKEGDSGPRGLTRTAEEMLSRLKQFNENRTDYNADRYIPGPLPARGHDLAETVDLLSGLVINNGGDSVNTTNNIFSTIAPLDNTASAALVSHSLAVFLSGLQRPYHHRLVSRIVSDTTLWISRLFRFFDTSACFHDEHHDGVVSICRALLRMRYPKYDVDGYESLYPRPPVIYLSPALGSGLGHTICNKLGLPRSCVCVVPGTRVSGRHLKIDVSSLERALHEDLATQRTPLLVIANAGASITGHVDNLQQLQDVCKTHDVWLHVEGHSLAALCLVPAPTLPARVGDSVTLHLGEWLGVYGLPKITLYKTLEPSVALASGLAPHTAKGKLNCLPLWISLLTLGHDGVINRIHHAFRLTRHLQDRITQITSITLLGKQSFDDKESKATSISELTSKAVSTAVLFDILSPTVAFQFVGQVKNRRPTDFDSSSDDHSVLSNAYFNCLNSWLGQILERDVPSVRLDIVELEDSMVCVCYSPLEGTRHQSSQVTMEDLDLFLSCLVKQVDILDATVKHKMAFPTLVAKHQNLELVDIAEWAGLGGVKYIPEGLKENMNELSDSGKEELNRINDELVTQLKATDSAFSLGEGEDGVYCVRFGMVTEDTDMEELLELVVKGGKSIEESSKNMEDMKEMIKKGIETAYEDLKKENDERIWQEGILRQVPVVGSLFNWWAPLPKETGVKGRSFNLSSGVIESTENIYKYHMQLQEGSSSRVGHATPKPVVHTPIIVSTSNDITSSPDEQQLERQTRNIVVPIEDKVDSNQSLFYGT